jgi:hypothetical protein
MRDLIFLYFDTIGFFGYGADLTLYYLWCLDDYLSEVFCFSDAIELNVLGVDCLEF